ncbi:Hypothetical protein POVR2_LOCUS353 [uncultured virus]|nr:Hypothetical protein POVR2_LOCUS353 [uncultured virus]
MASVHDRTTVLEMKYGVSMAHQLLPPFPASLYGDKLQLPIELQNEPYTFNDNGLRAEVYSNRKFLFQIDTGGVAHCQVGTGSVYNLEEQDPIDDFKQARMKRTSRVSVLSVYERYGMQVVYSYLHYLYYNKNFRAVPDWLNVYLSASLLEIGGQYYYHYDSSPYQTLFMCSEMLRLLADKDKNEPRLASDLYPVPEHTLPEELLSRVIGSMRVSKEIARNVLRQQCSAIPTYDELAVTHGIAGHEYDGQIIRSDPDTLMVSTTSAAGYLLVWSIRREGKKFIYEYQVTNDELESDNIVAFWLPDYERVFKDRGCNAEQAIVTMLEKIRRETSPTEENAEFICSWILSICYTLDLNVTTDDSKLEIVFNNIYELAEELDSLLEFAIGHYSSREVIDW